MLPKHLCVARGGSIPTFGCLVYPPFALHRELAVLDLRREDRLNVVKALDAYLDIFPNGVFQCVAAPLL